MVELHEEDEVKLHVKSAKAIQESAGDLTEKKIVGLLNGGESYLIEMISIIWIRSISKSSS